MEKKNTVLLLVIAVATLLVAVVGATFAFFASTMNTNTTVNVTAKTPAAASSFRSEGGGDIALIVTGTDMAETNELSGSETAVKDGSKTVTFHSMSGDASTTMVCTYSLVWNWASDTNAYVPTADLGTNGKEFTIQVTATGDAGTKTYDETQFAASSASPLTLVENATITNASSTVESEQVYTVTVRYYNTDTNQIDTQKDKTFKGTVSVVTGENPCTYSTGA